MRWEERQDQKGDCCKGDWGGENIKKDNRETGWQEVSENEKNQRGEEGKWIVSSKSLQAHLGASVPAAESITAVTEGPPYSRLCCNDKRIWRPQRPIQSNNYWFTVTVSSSKSDSATNQHFHLRVLPQDLRHTRRNTSPEAPLSHVGYGMCVQYRAIWVHLYVCSSVSVFGELE